MFIPQAQPHAQSLFLFPIVFGINLIHFFDISTRKNGAAGNSIVCFAASIPCQSRHLTVRRMRTVSKRATFLATESVNSAPFNRGETEVQIFWQGIGQNSSSILRCTFLARRSAKLIANFRATMVTSLPSFSLSLSPNVPNAQYRKRLRASYNRKRFRASYNSRHFSTQSSHSVDGAEWQAKMASINFCIPWRNAHGPHHKEQNALTESQQHLISRKKSSDLNFVPLQRKSGLKNSQKIRFDFPWIFGHFWCEWNCFLLWFNAFCRHFQNSSLQCEESDLDWLHTVRTPRIFSRGSCSHGCPCRTAESNEDCNKQGGPHTACNIRNQSISVFDLKKKEKTQARCQKWEPKSVAVLINSLTFLMVSKLEHAQWPGHADNW